MSDNWIPSEAERAASMTRNLAEADFFAAQARRELALAAAAEDSARLSALNSVRAERDHAFYAASDMQHRIYRLSGDITDDPRDGMLCSSCIEHLSRWHRVSPELPVEIVLTSFGGSAFDGMALFDQMLALREQGQLLRVTVRGVAASMAAILLQAASDGERVVGPGSTLVNHKLSAIAAGSLDQIEDAAAWFRLVQERVYDIYADRCQAAGAAGTASKSLNRAAIVRNFTRKDWPVTAQTAVELGLADRIG